jgi:hypothetical protein
LRKVLEALHSSGAIHNRPLSVPPWWTVKTVRSRSVQRGGSTEPGDVAWIPRLSVVEITVPVIRTNISTSYRCHDRACSTPDGDNGKNSCKVVMMSHLGTKSVSSPARMTSGY